MRYDRFDITGAVATAGSYAFLMPDGQSTSVVTTYEQLRTEATVMRVNVQDEHGASWATFYDAVAVGDIVEWYKADDCWVRYQVTSTPEPVAGASARDFGAEWVTYAGTGCKGAVPAAMRSSIGWAPLPVTSHAVPTPSRVALTPVRHGPWFLHPLGWEGDYEHEASYTPTVALLGDEASRGERATSRLPYPDPVSTHELAEARELQFWRDPVLPEGWSFGGALSGLLDTPLYGYCASYVNERGYLGVEICVFFTVHRPTHTTVPYRGDAGIIKETRIIDGHAALVEYSPQGPFHADHWRTVVRIFDGATGLQYKVKGYDRSLRGDSVASLIEIAASLIPPAASP